MFSVLFLASTAQAAGLMGVKVGVGEIDAENDAYTAGGTSYASVSASKDSQFAAIFAEVNVDAVDGLSIGAEFIPLSADVSLDNANASTSAEVSNYKTIYALISRDLGDVSGFLKVGYSHADVGTITSKSTIVSQDDAIQGPMIGVGFQREVASGIVGRLEATYTALDDVSATTTSNGSSSVKKTGSGDITTIGIAIAKSF
tara:strand:- start:13108 stop:13710 length:603 start_codon:yes stop_codon:yes gene_type:complete